MFHLPRVCSAPTRKLFALSTLLALTALAAWQSAQRSHAASRQLTLDDRITAQRAIETVYWRHRLWPKENPQPKPSLAEAVQAGCTFSISPASRAFAPAGGTGSVNVTTSSGCSWNASSNAAWITIISGSSGSGNGVMTYAVAPNPNNDSRTGTMTIAGQSFRITQITVLFIDGSAFGNAFGVTGGGTVYVVNRLTPPSYPATLSGASIYFPSNRGVRVGDSLTIFAGKHPSGSTNINGISLVTAFDSVRALGQFSNYSAPVLTIDSGDFVVGFRMTHAAGVFPFAVDSTEYRQRSYSSVDGTTFTPLFNPGAIGNLMIRALLLPETPACPTVTGLSSASGAIGSSLAITGTNLTRVIAVSFPNNVSTTFTVNSATQLTATVPVGAVTGPITISKAGCADVQTANFTVTQPCPIITLAPATLPTGTVGSTYNQPIMALPVLTAGNYNFSVTAGALPAGLSLNTMTGILSGTPSTAGTANFTITALSFGPCSGSQAYALTISNPAPVLTRLDPSAVTAGNGALTLAVMGSGFVSGATVRWNGADRSTTFVSAAQLTATIPASDLTTASTASVTVFNPAPGGGTSGAQSFAISNIAPSLLNLVPSVAIVAGGAFTLTVNGANFVTDSVVRWNGNNRATTFVSATRLTAAIPASDSAAAGTARVTVYNGPPGGGASNEATLTIANAMANVSAASFSATELAAETIVAAFGSNLSTATQAAATVPLPTTLAGTRMMVRDGAGVTRDAPLFFVSPNQINYLLPLGTANGAATVTVTSGNGNLAIGTVMIAAVAPGLFTANANGQGVPAAVALRAREGGAQSFESVAQFDAAAGRFVPVPIDLGASTDQVVLLLFGTGIRGRSNLSAVTCRLGGVETPVSFAGAQGDLVGLDQINVGPLPRTLAGRGEVDLVLLVEGKAANTVRLSIR